MELTDTQEQILDAAMSCIGRDGIDGASMRNVAREADVSLGLLSYHFDDKRSLIVAAFELSTNRLFEASVGSLGDIEGADDRVRALRPRARSMASSSIRSTSLCDWRSGRSRGPTTRSLLSSGTCTSGTPTR